MQYIIKYEHHKPMHLLIYIYTHAYILMLYNFTVYIYTCTYIHLNLHFKLLIEDKMTPIKLGNVFFLS